MAVPTIFTLAEDALRNVPRGFKEASYALGANRLQTIARVIVSASLSGIVSAILLGLGRVIGETMVVLLCAGNRIAIPDFSQGIGAIFQPVHTMTGIIAQEMGEVVRITLRFREPVWDDRPELERLRFLYSLDEWMPIFEVTKLETRIPTRITAMSSGVTPPPLAR